MDRALLLKFLALILAFVLSIYLVFPEKTRAASGGILDCTDPNNYQRCLDACKRIKEAYEGWMNGTKTPVPAPEVLEKARAQIERQCNPAKPVSVDSNDNVNAVPVNTLTPSVLTPREEVIKSEPSSTPTAELNETINVEQRIGLKAFLTRIIDNIKQLIKKLFNK
ncbi:MAG TPA: hypothetical protein VMW29_00035 [Candidatus Bathyarchaeia archaeon]|nr:hypothetical protein [Candidatus Bathyarchaeia archaeon]